MVKRIIYRYVFQFSQNGMTQINMPVGARVIKVDAKDAQPSIWAIVDPRVTDDLEIRTFFIVPTGVEFHTDMGKPEMAYIDSFQVPSTQGTLVFHLFEAERRGKH